MAIYDPMMAKFANAPLAPWQVSKKLFDFDAGFVKWICKYLELRKLVCDVVSAKAWINKAKFGDGERYELCTLQWEAYQESLKAPERPALKAVVGDLGGANDGDGHRGESDVDCDGDLPPLEPELPPEFAKLEGESGEAYRARMFASIQKNIKNIGKW